jgi:hypothetical protein
VSPAPEERLAELNLPLPPVTAPLDAPVEIELIAEVDD